MTTFADVKIGQTFQSDGITAVKQSSRTGKLVGGVGRVFYWGQKEPVTIVKGDYEDYIQTELEDQLDREDASNIEFEIDPDDLPSEDNAEDDE